ncbi:MAG: DoxX family membrane protein [Candidatus Levybacteria bacterium]|nr:DoxX family membrane protein [Candidatus Levybacteria bacterium]MBI2622863.1 DoxX family membrane protein [Candidatus Levybacteria bacterium]
MSKFAKLSLFLLRLSLGWLFFYAGITKVFDPNWTAAGYLKTAQTATGLYQWFASPQNITWVNFLNEWGLTLVGVALILGVFVRLAALSGILLMLLYYLPILNFPYVGRGTTSFLIDQHIIFILVLIALFFFRAGDHWGLSKTVRKFLPKPLQLFL